MNAERFKGDLESRYKFGNMYFHLFQRKQNGYLVIKIDIYDKLNYSGYLEQFTYSRNNFLKGKVQFLKMSKHSGIPRKLIKYACMRYSLFLIRVAYGYYNEKEWQRKS